MSQIAELRSSYKVFFYLQFFLSKYFDLGSDNITVLLRRAYYLYVLFQNFFIVIIVHLKEIKKSLVPSLVKQSKVISKRGSWLELLTKPA